MLETRKITCDLCVVGGGIAGMCAAVSAARNGAKVVLMHERSVLGGNASSEIRMWICGAGMQHNESGIIEEIELENAYRNPTKNWYIWSSILYDFIKREENITLLLDCPCMDATVEEGNFSDGRTRRIVSVKGYQTTTQRFYEVTAKNFADCSGDSILAPLTGAEFMLGRECKTDFGEPTYVEKADTMTMGMSCLIEGRETDEKIEFIPSERAARLSKEDLENREPDLYNPYENFWYLELGGNRDSIGDTEDLRDELICLALGTWNYIKNEEAPRYDTFELEFLGFIPGKRESRRMTGEYILTANDILSDRDFPDTVAYGGWTVDDHYPAGFYHKGMPNTHIVTPAPYRIPYRCLYSKNVENLFFAGRNISTTHMALSSTRVMKTCALLGQAIGTAASIAAKYSLTPHGVYKEKLLLLQNTLLRDDCFLPGRTRTLSPSCKSAVFSGDEALRDGIDRINRVYNNTSCGAVLENGRSVSYTFEKPENVGKIHLVFDSDLERETFAGDRCEKSHSTRSNILKTSPRQHIPYGLCKAFRVEAVEEDGAKTLLFEEKNNLLRCRSIPVNRKVKEISLTVTENHGGTDKTRIYSFDF